MSGPVVAAIARPQLPPERIRSVALAAEEAGLGELWLWEDCFWEGGVSMAGALLGATERLRVGVGLLPYPLRNVALAAMEIAALERLFPGRFVVGLGHGVQAWMEQAGARARSPLTLAGEYLTALRALLAGEEVSVSGDYVRLDRVRLVWPPATVPAIHAGATGPRSLRLTGELADGTILTAATQPGDLPEVRALVAEGRAASGRTGEHPFTVFVETTIRGAGAAVEAWTAAGAHRIALQPTDDETDPEGFVRAAAELSHP
jgi:alkanesulfonate monooxygenase SsuD/methylene tetrahydromethanopterin reductase-like flavin-dependent oxidoreductase (luciferase family)